MPMLIFAVLLAIMQAVPPVPRKAPDDQASQTAKRHGKANASQDNATEPIFSTQSPSAPHSDGAANPATPSDAGETIIISEPAAVSHKDTWDKTYVVFTGLLVFVGSAGVYFARKSLLAIESQLKEMRSQVTEMQNAGMQTGQIIERMKDTAERELRAYVCMESARIVFKKERAPQVHVCIKNFGKTPAYDVRMWIGGATGPYPAPEPLKPPRDEFPMGVSILPPEAKPYTMIWFSDEIPNT